MKVNKLLNIRMRRLDKTIRQGLTRSQIESAYTAGICFILLYLILILAVILNYA